MYKSLSIRYPTPSSPYNRCTHHTPPYLSGIRPLPLQKAAVWPSISISPELRTIIWNILFSNKFKGPSNGQNIPHPTFPSSSRCFSTVSLHKINQTANNHNNNNKSSPTANNPNSHRQPIHKKAHDIVPDTPLKDTHLREQELDDLSQFVNEANGKLLVITGAGLR